MTFEFSVNYKTNYALCFVVETYMLYLLTIFYKYIFFPAANFGHKSPPRTSNSSSSASGAASTPASSAVTNGVHAESNHVDAPETSAEGMYSIRVLNDSMDFEVDN